MYAKWKWTLNLTNMTTEELFNICDLKVATTQRLATSEPFECENEDLNDFFVKDSAIYSERLLGKTYLLCLKENPKVIVAAFTVSNDSIRMTNKLNEDAKLEFLQNSSLEDKRLRRFPAVLIGRLATNKIFAGKGIGTAVMTFIKSWFRFNNKTGCRFVIVDAYSNEATLHYYIKNGFKFLVDDERLEAKYMEIGMGRLPLHTRLMYYDLLEVKTFE